MSEHQCTCVLNPKICPVHPYKEPPADANALAAAPSPGNREQALRDLIAKWPHDKYMNTPTSECKPNCRRCQVGAALATQDAAPATALLSEEQVEQPAQPLHVAVVTPGWAQEILANPNASPEELERAHQATHEIPCEHEAAQPLQREVSSAWTLEQWQANAKYWNEQCLEAWKQRDWLANIICDYCGKKAERHFCAEHAAPLQPQVEELESDDEWFECGTGEIAANPGKFPYAVVDGGRLLLPPGGWPVGQKVSIAVRKLLAPPEETKK